MRKLLLMVMIISALVISSVPACAVGEQDILPLFFPGKSFSPQDDFYYGLDPKTREMDEIHWRLKEARPVNGATLAVLEGYATSHSVGYWHMIFGLVKDGQLLGEPLHIYGDWGEYYIAYRGGRLSVLAFSGTRWTGLEGYGGGLWDFDGATWQMRWPWADAYGDFWTRLKPVIAYDPPGTVELYEFMPDPEGESLGGGHWKWKETVSPLG